MPTPATHVWKPSNARTVVLDSFIPVPRGSTAMAPPPLNWPTKDPADVLDYQFDISPALVGNDGDAIATLDVTIEPANPGDLVLNSATTDGALAIVWLSGGQPGTIYTVNLVITTVNGRTINRTILLPVLYLSVPPIPPNALITDTGVVLTDQNGNPVLTSRNVSTGRLPSSCSQPSYSPRSLGACAERSSRSCRQSISSRPPRQRPTTTSCWSAKAASLAR